MYGKAFSLNSRPAPAGNVLRLKNPSALLFRMKTCRVFSFLKMKYRKTVFFLQMRLSVVCWTGVRSYLKENLMSMIEVHAEVFSISPKFVARVMGKVTEAVVEEVTRLILCVDAFGANGALQVKLRKETSGCRMVT